MFKSIKYRITLYCVLLAASAATAGGLMAEGRTLWALLAVLTALISLQGLLKGYGKLNRNFIFLLNAIENGDYSFNFSETGLSRREKELNGVLNAIKEILARAREEEIENEKFLSLIVAAIPVGIVIVDERDFVTVSNDAALRLLGLHVFTHTKQLEMVDPAVYETFRNLTPGGKATIRVADEREERLMSLSSSQIRFKNGTLRVVTMSNIAGELEEREMESWIKLIRVMTHEIMNSIAPVTSLSETMLTAWNSGQGEDERVLRRNTVEAFETIASTAHALLSFVESYRRFTGIPAPVLRPVKAVPLVEKALKLESEAFRQRGIEAEVRSDDAGITVDADEGQITQVLVNLLKNAAEAIPPSQTGGRVEVRVFARDGKVHIEVADNGLPVPEDVLPHIFVPFFTTKQEGTGIGLSVSRYIMRLHGGNLKHHTGGGCTVFGMVFPGPPAHS